MDGSPEVTLIDSGNPGDLIIRCKQRKTELYVRTDHIIDNAWVRIKFDDSPPSRESWSESSGNDAVFARDPIGIARKLVKSKRFLVEYHPFQRTPETEEFDVRGLGEVIGEISTACNWAGADKRKAEAETIIRRELSSHVHTCPGSPNKWCWSDPNEAGMTVEEHAFATQKAALDDAVRAKRSYEAFVF
jgi:hypothetical protein